MSLKEVCTEMNLEGGKELKNFYGSRMDPTESRVGNH